MQSKQSNKAIDLENFLEKHPLNFLLFYGDYEVINTVYLDDGSPLVDLSMELFNQSPKKVVKFTAPPNKTSPASADNCHFSLALEGIFVLESAPEGWEVASGDTKSYSGTNFYFLKREAGELQPKAANASNNKIVLNLRKFRALPEGGTRTIRAELTYGPLLKDQDNKPFQDEYGQYFSYGNTIFITNNRGGKKTLPLQVDFAAGNSVLNDGTATNSLELLIANKNWPSSNLSLSQDSEFVIRFEMGNQEGAVATDTQIKAIGIESLSINWSVQHVLNSTEWTVKPKSGISQLASNEAIKLNITNLVTGNSSGAGYLYIRYKNIPNYPDGQFVVTVEKSPLLYRLAQVGIGTTNPSAKLHVSGGDALIGGKLTSNGDATIGGKVGIGTTSPSAKLEVKLADTTTTDSSLKLEHNGSNFTVSPHRGGGNNSTIIQNTGGGSLIINPSSGNVGIGTTAPSAKLHVSGGDVIVSGRLAIGTTVSSHIHLTIGDDDTGLKQQGDGKLAIYTNNAERVRIDENGNVAIGTTDLTHRLHIGGKNSTLRLSGEGTYGVGATLNFGDRNEVYITEDEDRKLLIHADTRISLESNVGIGTKNPSAKLHVSGGDAIISGKVGIGITTPSANAAPKIHLAIGDDDTGLQQQGDGKLAIYTDNVERVRIEKNGNVGIGTTNPQQKLHVEGRIRLSDVPVWNGANSCDVTWVGESGWGSNDNNWNCIAREGSSERYKQNIAPLEDDFQKLLSLQPKQYQMKEGYGDPNTWEFGYLAEELDKIGLKSLVIYNRSGQPDGIQYKKICIYLNEVVKSQQSSMERLEEKVNELNEKLMSSL